MHAPSLSIYAWPLGNQGRAVSARTVKSPEHERVPRALPIARSIRGFLPLPESMRRLHERSTSEAVLVALGLLPELPVLRTDTHDPQGQASSRLKTTRREPSRLKASSGPLRATHCQHVPRPRHPRLRPRPSSVRTPPRARRDLEQDSGSLPSRGPPPVRALAGTTPAPVAVPVARLA